MNAQERIFRICEDIQDFYDLYESRVRHYTIKEHSLNVYNQFETYFSINFTEFDIEQFRLFLLLHDIGKPIAYKKGNKDNQNQETLKIIQENKDKLSLGDEDFQLFVALLITDYLGLFMQSKISLEEAYETIINQSKIANLDAASFFYLSSVYYQCDIASYTQDAGGYKYLEHLFVYHNNKKCFNAKLKLLQFSSEFDYKYKTLLDKVTGNIHDEIINTAKEFSNISYIKGNIFNSRAQTIVNTVNCVGVMGKGIALVFKLRYPKMFDIYKKHCADKQISIGKLWLYDQQKDAPWVLNFPTKFHWKYPSKLEYIHAGLTKFIQMYRSKNISSIAFPLLGTHSGGLDKETVKEIMISYLSKCEIPIEIYDYDPFAPDDLFNSFREKWNKLSTDDIKKATGIQPQYIKKINSVLEDPKVSSMVTLVSYDGIGEKTLQKAFEFAMNYQQENLFSES